MKITGTSRLKSRINSIVMLVLILCLTVLLAWLSVRYQIQMDWTQSGRHTLSHASQEVLDRMEGPVEITAYALEDTALRQTIEKIVGGYQRLKADIDLHFVDPNAAPDAVRSAGITVNGEMIIRYQNRIEHVKSGTEKEFTNALERLRRGTEHWLAFLKGHGERDPFGKANHDLGLWASQLVSRGFKIQPLDLANTRVIPNNTKTLVIASPTVDLLAGEIALIVEYLLGGGNILWLADPGSQHGLQPLADQLGIEISSGIVIDSASSLIGIEDPTIVLSTPGLNTGHPVTKDFDLTTVFPTTTSVQVTKDPDWKKSSLLNSAAHTWQETGSLEGEVEYNEDIDTIGPLDIAISLERPVNNPSDEASATMQQRIIVIGDGDFLSNAYVGNGGNLDLGVRLINWLSNDDDFINIPSKTVNDAHIELSTFAATIIGFSFILVLPLGLLGTGLTIWWRRKKQ